MVEPLVGLLAVLCLLPLCRRPRPPHITARPLRVSAVVVVGDNPAAAPSILNALRTQIEPPHEIIVVDSATDSLAARAARLAGCTLVNPGTPAHGWTRRAWEQHQGALQARGELILLVEPDQFLAPETLQRAAATLTACNADVVSMEPWHLAHTAGEKLMGVFHVLRLVLMGASNAVPVENRHCQPGFLLVRRDAYERLCGLSRARDLRRQGGRVRYLTDGTGPRVRLFSGLLMQLRGWRSELVYEMREATLVDGARLGIVLGWLVGAPLWLATATSWVPLSVAAVHQLSVLVVLALAMRLRGHFPTWSVLFYPLGVLLFLAVCALALVDLARGRIHDEHQRPRLLRRATPLATAIARGHRDVAA